MAGSADVDRKCRRIVVGLAARFSNCSQLEFEEPPADTKPLEPYVPGGVTKLTRPNRRLSISEMDQLAQEYAAGATARELAAKWEVSLTTVKRHMAKREIRKNRSRR